jgi:hypothetical protein
MSTTALNYVASREEAVRSLETVSASRPTFYGKNSEPIAHVGDQGILEMDSSFIAVEDALNLTAWIVATFKGEA